MSRTADQGCEQPFRINKFEWKIASEEIQTSTLFLTCPVMPFNKQMPTEQDVQVIEENRRHIGPPANARDESAIKLEETSLKDGKASFGSENDVGQASEKRVVEIGTSNLDIVENENVIEASISGCDGANLNCDPRLTGHETLLQDWACGLHVNAKFSSPNPTSGVYTTGNFEARLSKSQSCDFNKCTSSMCSVDSGLSQHSCLETSCSELTIADELGKNTNISPTGTTAEGCSQCNLFRSLWNSSYNQSRDKFIAVLGNAVRKRVWNLPRTNSDSVSSNFSSGSTSEANSFTSSGVQHKDARVGILFSGGIDSMIIAALADK